MRLADWLGFAVAFLLCFGVAAIGGAVTAPAIPAWHAHLVKPAFNPPNWVFAPVWTLLYAMMAVAAGLVWRERGRRPVRLALGFFLVQLALNLGWTLLFFGARRIDLAANEILVLDGAVAATLLAFRPVSRAAAWLLAPYLGWSIFATVLCWEIWKLNP
jgi:tryptophan-rich sensory protein